MDPHVWGISDRTVADRPPPASNQKGAKQLLQGVRMRAPRARRGAMGPHKGPRGVRGKAPSNQYPIMTLVWDV